MKYLSNFSILFVFAIVFMAADCADDIVPNIPVDLEFSESFSLNATPAGDFNFTESADVSSEINTNLEKNNATIDQIISVKPKRATLVLTGGSGFSLENITSAKLSISAGSKSAVELFSQSLAGATGNSIEIPIEGDIDLVDYIKEKTVNYTFEGTSDADLESGASIKLTILTTTVIDPIQ